jgi:hypothetical protein
MSGMSNMRPAGRMSCVALMTTKMWPICPSGDPRFDMPGLDHTQFDVRHTHTHTHVHAHASSYLIGLLWTDDQLFAGPANYATYNINHVIFQRVSNSQSQHQAAQTARLRKRQFKILTDPFGCNHCKQNYFRCCIPSFGWFRGICILCADVREHTAPKQRTAWHLAEGTTVLCNIGHSLPNDRQTDSSNPKQLNIQPQVLNKLCARE